MKPSIIQNIIIFIISSISINIHATTKRVMANILPIEQCLRHENNQIGNLVANFLKNQSKINNFTPSGIDNNEYLRQIERQIKVFYNYQDTVSGAIIDPVYKIEWQYSTPCYALSVGLLAQTGFIKNTDIITSGIKALDCSVNEMYENKCAHHHGEFFIQPIMLALDLYENIVPPKQIDIWLEKIKTVDPYLLYKDNLKRKKYCYNHNVVALSGEYLRYKRNVCKDKEFLDIHLKHQQQYFSCFGLYIDNRTNPPMAYDEFTRQFLASILVEGYKGKYFNFYAKKLQLGAWTSLFMQSPFGEIPTGGRSAQHIWNEAAAAVTYEIYASQYAFQGEMEKAGTFKRAAHLALKSISRWEREDGSGFIVKNRFPIEAMHGYESYSAQSQYNLLACWLMCVAYLYADNSIHEYPAPADIGGYVLIMKDVFHKVFANSCGNYIEYELSGDPRYNSTGLIRLHLKNSNPQLGPSDGIPHQWDNKKKKDLGGELYSVGPAWFDTNGQEHRLAEYTNIIYPDSNLYSAYKSFQKPKIQTKIIKQSPQEVQFKIIYNGNFNNVTQISQCISIDKSGISICDSLKGDIQRLRIYYPMLIDDGMEKTKIDIKKHRMILQNRDGGICFQAVNPSAFIKRKNKKFYYRNGYADVAYFDSNKNIAKYKITTY